MTIDIAIKIITNLGLPIFLVLYYLFIIRKEEQKKHSSLIEKFGISNKTCLQCCEYYKQLVSDIKPETRTLSIAQTRALGEVGLDRDYFKIYHRMIGFCSKHKENNLNDHSINEYLDSSFKESIFETGKIWSIFNTPIGNLKEHFEEINNGGSSFKNELIQLLKNKQDLTKKIDDIDIFLFNWITRSKDNLISKLKQGDRRRIFFP